MSFFISFISSSRYWVIIFLNCSFAFPLTASSSIAAFTAAARFTAFFVFFNVFRILETLAFLSAYIAGFFISGVLAFTTTFFLLSVIFFFKYFLSLSNCFLYFSYKPYFSIIFIASLFLSSPHSFFNSTHFVLHLEKSLHTTKNSERKSEYFYLQLLISSSLDSFPLQSDASYLSFFVSFFMKFLCFSDLMTLPCPADFKP